MSKKLSIPKDTAHDLFHIQKHSPIQLHASAISLNILFSLFPFLLMITSLFGFIGFSEDRSTGLLASIQAIIPVSLYTYLAETLLPLLSQKSVGVFSVAFILLIWAVGKTTRSIVRSLDRIYMNENPRPFGKHFLFAFSSALVIGLGFFLSVNLLLWGNMLSEWLAKTFELPIVFQILFSNLHWPLLILFTFLFFWFIYRFVPNHESRGLKQHVPGAILATGTLIAGSYLASLYLSHFRGFEVYGTIGIIIVLILFIQVSSYAFLIGAFLNSAHELREGKSGLFRGAWHTMHDALR